MLYSCSRRRLVWNPCSLISAHPKEGCPEDHRTTDDTHVHLPVNKPWIDKLDLNLEKAQSMLLADFRFVWLAMRKDTRCKSFSFQNSPVLACRTADKCSYAAVVFLP